MQTQPSEWLEFYRSKGDVVHEVLINVETKTLALPAAQLCYGEKPICRQMETM